VEGHPPGTTIAIAIPRSATNGTTLAYPMTFCVYCTLYVAPYRGKVWKYAKLASEQITGDQPRWNSPLNFKQLAAKNWFL
jgi:hypothetical protein